MYIVLHNPQSTSDIIQQCPLLSVVSLQVIDSDIYIYVYI